MSTTTGCVCFEVKLLLLRFIICSVGVLAATNSQLYVAVSTVACLIVGVVLTKYNTAVIISVYNVME